MSNLFRIFSFVPPMFLFILPAIAQLSGTIEQNPVSSTYTVSVIPSVNWVPPSSVTSSGIITLKATTGKLQVSDFQSLTGIWISTGVFAAPAEASGFDYFTFALQNALPTVAYNSGVKLGLFSFKNSFGCTAVEIIDNQSDPFLEPNSLNVGISNYFSVIGAGNGVNAYASNTAEDFIGCAPLAFSVTAATNPVLCYGDVTDITITVSGGKEPYQVDWVNTTTSDTGTFQILDFEGNSMLPSMPAGNYVFTIADDLDSAQVTNLLLTQPASPLSIELLAFDASCNGSLDGVVQVEKASGGTVAGSYQFVWNGFPAETDSIVSNIDPGTYSVTVSDDNGCTATGSAAVGSFVVIFPNAVVKNVICNGDANGIIDLYPVSPNPPFTYEWSNNVMSGNLSSAWQLGPGTYSVTITDASGVCNEVATYSITEPLAIEVDYRLTEPKCYGDKGLLEIIGISNAVEPWEAEVIGGENVADGSKFLLEPGLPLQLVVEDAKGCTATEDFIVASKQELQLALGESRSIKYGEQIHFEPIYFPFENVMFTWTPADGLSCTDCPNPIATPTEDVTYLLKMTDTSGCTIDDYVNVSVRKSRDIFIPNSFSPNQDGINDVFYPYGSFEIVAIHSMQVFDRWGSKLFVAKELFSPNDAQAGWDGLAKNKPADPGTYLYTMNVEFIDGEIIMFSGEVNLIK